MFSWYVIPQALCSLESAMVVQTRSHHTGQSLNDRQQINHLVARQRANSSSVNLPIQGMTSDIPHSPFPRSWRLRSTNKHWPSSLYLFYETETLSWPKTFVHGPRLVSRSAGDRTQPPWWRMGRLCGTDTSCLTVRDSCDDEDHLSLASGNKAGIR